MARVRAARVAASVKQRMSAAPSPNWSQAWVAAAAVTVLFFVAVASRTAASESRQGAFAAAQTRMTAQRLQAEATALWKAAQQDGSVVTALWHNAEGQGLCRAAQRLLLHSGLPIPDDLLDVAAALQEDRDDLLERLPEDLRP